MTAYGFKSVFVPQMRNRTKGQTIRANGKRKHAQPGSLIQFYCGMRTAYCYKIMPDQPCVRLDHVVFDVRRPAAPHLEVNGVPFAPWTEQADGYALFDGFSFKYVDGPWLIPEKYRARPFGTMVEFWLMNHGPICFEGTAIAWIDMRDWAANLTSLATMSLAQRH